MSILAEHPYRRLYYLFLALALLPVCPLVTAAESRAVDEFISEQFANLEQWTEVHFPKIERHSSYSIVPRKASDTALQAVSDNSASALRFQKEFNVYRYPKLQFEWKVDSVYQKADPQTKSGDDYPIRLYVAFRYDPDKASFTERAKYRAAKLLHGEYPPHSSLNYVWASSKPTERIITSPYTDRAKMIVLDWGAKDAGLWRMHTVDIVEDYREAFGEDPPDTATLAIMNDSDNTGEASVSYVDTISLSRTVALPQAAKE